MSKLKLPLLSLFALGLVACGGSENDGASASTGGSGGSIATGGAGGAGGSAGTAGSAGAPSGGASGSCAPGSHVDGDGCLSDIESWSNAPPLASARDHHVTFAVETPTGRYLFATGGVKDMSSAVTSTERSSIAADGSLSDFSAETKLPEPVAGAGVAQIGSTVILTSGMRPVGTKLGLSGRVNVAEVAADGSIAAWKKGPELATARFHAASVAVGSFVYTIGGLAGDGTDNTPSVEVAKFDAGELGAWKETTPLPDKRSHHAVFTHDQRVYVAGGLSGDPAGANVGYSDVIAASVNADGSLSEWKTVGSLPDALATHSAAVLGDSVFLVGGVIGSGFAAMNTAGVWRAKIAKDGSLGSFEPELDLPKARAHAHQTPIVNGFLYSVAGAFEHASMTDVFVAKLK